VSANAAGDDSGNAASGPSDETFPATYAIGPDSRRVVITSKASNLGAPDTNGGDDIYVATPRSRPDSQETAERPLSAPSVVGRRDVTA
jgi:hypothetical protein